MHPTQIMVNSLISWAARVGDDERLACDTEAILTH